MPRPASRGVFPAPFAALAVPFLLLAAGPRALAGTADLRTVAERSAYRRTASHAEVVELADRLAGTSERVRRLSLGTSHEGRDIPLLVVADPAAGTPDEARSAGRTVALLLGGIHAGEACGKEALLRLARELGTGDRPDLLDRLVVAIVPVLNPDGNEDVDPEHRPHQKGPREGAGARANGQGLDLNRDWVKLEAPETRAVVRFLARWDPAFVLDTHTTNGTRHRHLITWAGPKHPATDPRLQELVRDRLIPEVGRRLEASHDLHLFPYGNLTEDRRQWTTYPALPRYGTPYRGLRGRVAVLSEAYSRASFEERVTGTHAFARACVDWLAEHAGEVRDLTAAVDDAAVEAGRSPDAARPLPLRARARPRPEPATLRTFRAVEHDGERRVTDEPVELEVEVLDRFEATRSVERARAYLVPQELDAAAENLLAHGVRLRELRADIALECDVYRVDAIERAGEPFQGRRLVSLEATRRRERRRVPAGTLVVPADQPLGPLAGYLLEPEAADGLGAWGLIGGIEEGDDWPVLRLRELPPLRTVERRPAWERPETPRPVDWETVYERGERPPSGRAASILRWLPDGEHWLDTREGELLRVRAEDGRTEPFHDAGPMARALAELPGVDGDEARRLVDGPRLELDPPARAVLLRHAGDLWWCPLEPDEDLRPRRLTSSPGEEELATFSPGGEWVAFVRGDDLHAVDVATGTVRRLTTGGGGAVRNGKATWVYYEEVFHRNWKTFWWSPGGERIAFLRTDASRVPPFTVVDNRPGRQDVERARYPKPGEPNPTVRLGIADPAGGRTRWVDLSRWDPDDLLVTGVGWTPDAGRVWFLAQNRIQTRLELCAASARGGEPAVLLEQTTEAWVEPPLGPRFLEDGTFLVTSERSGWRRLLHRAADGSPVRELTTGEWEVRDLLEVDEDAGVAFVTGTRDGPLGENLYRVALDGSGVERVTPGRGTHRIDMAPRGRLFLDTHSRHDRPPRVTLRDAEGASVRTVDANPAPKLDDWDLLPAELTSIPAGDGFELPASIVRPPDFDPGRRWPVWIRTYGGPRYPTVRDAWGHGRVWDQCLARRGLVVVRVDPRSATGQGAVAAWSCYRQLGVQELADLEDAVRWLRDRPWVDPERIGLAGHSYGGFLTAYALTHSDLFAAGIAGAPVTDWKDYDTIYTERYMQTPRLNPEGYRETSVVRGADDLDGRLLLAHGTIDDNVHLQNTLRLVHALQRAEETFELMVYPGSRHGIWGGHYRRLRWDFIGRAVGGPPRAPARATAADARAAGGESSAGDGSGVGSPDSPESSGAASDADAGGG